MIILTACMVLLLASHVDANVAPPCNAETEALVELDGHVSSSAYITIFNNTNHDSYGRLSNDLFSSFVESETGTWQGCVPADACFMATILPLDRSSSEEDSIIFRYNGNVIETSFAFPEGSKFTRTFVEFGNCIPRCNEDTESLLEFDAYVGGSGTTPIWWIQDGNETRVVECDQASETEDLDHHQCFFQSYPYGTDRFHRIRHCLPTNECHLFIAGDAGYQVGQYGADFFTYFNLTFGGELFASRRDGFRFESIEFGCEEKELTCEDDNKALLELFINRGLSSSSENGLSINKTFQVQDGLEVLLEKRLGSNDSLHYYRACLPRDACLNLTLSVAEMHNLTSARKGLNHATDYFEHGEIQLVFDNFIFRDSDYEFSYRRRDHGISLSDVTSFGNCNVAGFCNDTELRQDVNFTGPKENDAASYYHSFTARVQYMNEFWDDERPYPIDYEQVFIGFMPGKIYRSTHCIPSTECTELWVEGNGTQSFDYSIAVNDEVREERRQWEHKNYRPYVLTTLGGDNCPQELSRGSIAGIVIGCLVVAVALVPVAKWIRKVNSPRPRPVTIQPAGDECTCTSDEETDQDVATAVTLERNVDADTEDSCSEHVVFHNAC